MEMNVERWIEDLVAGCPGMHVARSDTGKFTSGAVSPRTVANMESRRPDDVADGRFVVGKKIMYPKRSYAEWLAKKFYKTVQKVV